MNVKDLRLFFKDRKGNLPIVIINESTGERLLLKPEMIERILSAEFGGEDPDAIGIIFSGEKVADNTSGREDKPSGIMSTNGLNFTNINFSCKHSFTFFEKIMILLGRSVYAEFSLDIKDGKFSVNSECVV